MAHELETRVVDQVLDVALGAGEEIVEAHDLMAALDQPVAQMRAEKAGAAGDKDPLCDYRRGERIERGSPHFSFCTWHRLK